MNLLIIAAILFSIWFFTKKGSLETMSNPNTKVTPVSSYQHGVLIPPRTVQGM